MEDHKEMILGPTINLAHSGTNPAHIYLTHIITQEDGVKVIEFYEPLSDREQVLADGVRDNFQLLLWHEDRGEMG